MEELLKSLPQVTVPDEMRKTVQIQLYLGNLNSNTFENTVDFISQNCVTDLELRLFVVDLVHVADKRFHEQKLFAELAYQVLMKTGNNILKTTLLNFGSPQIIRQLFLKGVYSLSDIRKKCAQDDVFRFFFQPELQLTRDFLKNSAFAGIMSIYDSDLKQNDFEIMKEWIDNGWSKSTRGFMLKFDKVDELKEFVRDDPEVAAQEIQWSPFETKIDKETLPLIAAAAYFGSFNTFKYLAEVLADDFHCEEYAVKGGNMDIINYCKNLPEADFSKCQTWACQSYRYDLLHTMIEIDDRKPYPDQMVYIRNLYGFFYSIDNKFNPNSKSSKDAFSMLDYACSQGDTNLVRFLLAKGAKVNECSQQIYPIHTAALNGFADIVSILIENGANIESKDKGDFVPLHFAAREGRYQVVKLLLEKGAQVDSKTRWDQTPLQLAIEKRHHNESILLIQYGANINIRCNDIGENYVSKERTILHFAAKDGDFELVKYLIEHNMEVDPLDCYRTTPLLLAAENNHTEICEYLVEHGADPNLKGTDPQTALHYAAKNNNFELVKFLVEHKADVRAKGSNGFPFRCTTNKEIKDYLTQKMREK